MTLKKEKCTPKYILPKIMYVHIVERDIIQNMVFLKPDDSNTLWKKQPKMHIIFVWNSSNWKTDKHLLRKQTHFNLLIFCIKKNANWDIIGESTAKKILQFYKIFTKIIECLSFTSDLGEAFRF